MIDSEAGAGKGIRAFFLDRDGVINVDHGYVFCAENFKFMADIFPVLRGLSAKGYLLVVVTNQSGIGRGYYSEEDYQKLMNWMLERLSCEGIEVSAVYSCPHSPEEGCDCRKPAPGMLLQAKQELGLDMSESWMIGDKASDMDAAKAAGIPNRVFLGEVVPTSATVSVATLAEVLTLPV